MSTLTLEKDVHYLIKDNEIQIKSENPININAPEKEVAFLVGSLARKTYYSEKIQLHSKTYDEINKFKGDYEGLKKLFKFLTQRLNENNRNSDIINIIEAKLENIKEWDLSKEDCKLYVTIGQTIPQKH